MTQNCVQSTSLDHPVSSRRWSFPFNFPDFPFPLEPCALDFPEEKEPLLLYLGHLFCGTSETAACKAIGVVKKPSLRSASFVTARNAFAKVYPYSLTTNLMASFLNLSSKDNTMAQSGFTFCCPPSLVGIWIPNTRSNEIHKFVEISCLQCMKTILRPVTGRHAQPSKHLDPHDLSYSSSVLLASSLCSSS